MPPAKKTTTKKSTAKKSSSKRANKLVRVLSIDGGGILGILPGQILVKLESILQEESGKPTARIADYFDLIVGTSTGGILSAIYACPDRLGSTKPRPKYSAQQAVDVYLERGDEIFSLNIWEKARTLGGLIDEKYPADELEDALQDYLGDTLLSQTLKPCLIPAYNIKDRTPFFFRSAKAEKDLDYNFLLRDVCRATSAAPTYFETARVKSRKTPPSKFPLIDGGVFANNPAMCAYSEARSSDIFGPGRPKHPTAQQMAILSVGTDDNQRLPRYTYGMTHDWGKAEWVVPLISILMQGNSTTVDYQLKMIFDTLPRGHRNQYLRVVSPLGDKTDGAMDCATPDNLRRLAEDGARSADNQETKLRAFAKLLVANA